MTEIKEPADNLPANTGRLSTVDAMFGQRRRWWANIKSTVDQRLMFAGLVLYSSFFWFFMMVVFIVNDLLNMHGLLQILE